MARTPSNMISLGSIAPDFILIDVTSASNFSLKENKGTVGTVIMFICNHCPYVKHVNPTISKLAKEYQSDEIKFIAISSNDVVNYPEDSPEKMKKNAIENDFNFPYLYDDNLKLVYRGQLDDSRPGNEIESNGNDIKNAIDCLINRIENNDLQKPSIGCNIKWK